MIESKSLEKKVLSGLLQYPDKWAEVSSFIVEDDFYSEESKVHVSLFKMLRNALNNREVIDDTILIERVKGQKISFPDSIDLEEYIRSLKYLKISAEIFINSVRELKKFTIRRKLYDSAAEIQRHASKVDPSLPYSQIVEGADRIFNDMIRSFEMGESKLVNLAEIAEEIVEDRGENPPEEVGFMGPLDSVNKIYGSLLRPGNITTITARSKVGKTLFAIDYLLDVAYRYKVPILHFDNGEMSEEELVFRMVAGQSGVPMHLLESGKWRRCGYGDWSAKEVVDRVRSVWSRIKDIKILYENVAGMSSDEMVSLLKRIYYSEIGRGNQMVFSFDYLKSDFNNAGKGSDWLLVGKTLHDFKQCISRELKFDGKPCVSMFTSIQSNRQGITNNRTSDAIIEDESVVSLSDNVTQFTSFLFLLRKKTLDEIIDEGEEFGTHKLKCLVARHLGEDPFGHLEPVKTEDGMLKNNFINLKIENFKVKDCGDLRDIVSAKRGDDVKAKKGIPEYEEELPDLFHK